MLNMFACKSIDKETINIDDTATSTINVNKQKADFTIATTFINDYVRFLHKHFEGNADTTQLNWIMQHPLLTKKFKKEYKTLFDAIKADPEMGLDFDPIVDAQDFPDNGYEIASIDSTNNYFVMKAKEHGGFNITMKLAKEDNRWMVDGCGVINIPENKMAGRD